MSNQHEKPSFLGEMVRSLCYIRRLPARKGAQVAIDMYRKADPGSLAESLYKAEAMAATARAMKEDRCH